MTLFSLSYGIYNAITTKNDKGLRILMYHSIGSEVPGDTLSLYSISPDRFSKQMDLLKKKYTNKLVSLSLQNREGIAITFDDGYKDNLTIAAPLLSIRNIPFTVFVAPRLITCGDKRYLDKYTLKELSCYPNVTIGAHGFNHIKLTDLDENKILKELYDSKHFLEDIIGMPVCTMSYPHGGRSDRIEELVKHAGYHLAASSKAGLNYSEFNPFCLKRTDIWTDDSLWDFRSKLRGDYDWLTRLTN
jgi:peptidoglycan/xylan/chitin deacetylase (PgdA/CDA1 family)